MLLVSPKLLLRSCLSAPVPLSEPSLAGGCRVLLSSPEHSSGAAFPPTGWSQFDFFLSVSSHRIVYCLMFSCSCPFFHLMEDGRRAPNGENEDCTTDTIGWTERGFYSQHNQMCLSFVRAVPGFRHQRREDVNSRNNLFGLI